MRAMRPEGRADRGVSANCWCGPRLGTARLFRGSRSVPAGKDRPMPSNVIVDANCLVGAPPVPDQLQAQRAQTRMDGLRRRH